MNTSVFKKTGKVYQLLVLLGASVMEGLKKCDTGERSRATLIICPLSVLSNWIVSLMPVCLKWDIIFVRKKGLLGIHMTFISLSFCSVNYVC